MDFLIEYTVLSNIMNSSSLEVSILYLKGIDFLFVFLLRVLHRNYKSGILLLLVSQVKSGESTR